CPHSLLQLEPSPFAALAGFAQPTAQQCAAAATGSGRATKAAFIEPHLDFPAPLVLPHDDLNYDPDCSPQSVKSWAQLKSRNKLSPRNVRDTLYVARVPTIAKEVEFMRTWTTPVLSGASRAAVFKSIPSPSTELFVDYLRSFYYGLNIKVLQTPLEWIAWDSVNQPRRNVNQPRYVGLAHDDECTRVRVRSAPDGKFIAQLNLDDIIDAAISVLPVNAYALVLLVDHDIHENEDDDFCYGRAYGGSRVAVVQTARYNPCLDACDNIDRSHMWPSSHCKMFVDELCAVEGVQQRPPTKQQSGNSRKGSMRATIDAAMAQGTAGDTAQLSSCLWFSRVARTVSHELGHCFGLAHCVYYACNMQGTASMKEDVRQPPYLCPVCEAKVAHAIV
ncbi:hypothetical protein EK21DRAFT_42009, partial [Setomelanomma holmii]